MLHSSEYGCVASDHIYLIRPNVRGCFRWRAALCICMALSGVTCSPPPPSATIEAIEAIEPHDEDREGKPVFRIPPLST